MEKKILVAYASRSASTAEMAEEIGKVIAGHGASVDVKPINNKIRVDGYHAVVIGSGVYAGNWSGAAKSFIQKNHERLSQVPVALFQVCLAMKEDTPFNRQLVENYIKPVAQMVKPVDYATFAGKMDYSRLDFFTRFLIMNLIKAPEGDFRNWGTIRQWSGNVAPKLLKVQ